MAAVAGGVIVLAAVGLGALLAADRGPVPAASSVFATAEDVRALRGRLDALIAVQAAPALQRATAVEPGAGREEGPAAVRDRGAEAARDDHAPPATSLAHTLEGHRMVAKSCDEPTGSRRVEIRVGSRYARTGEVFGFEPRTIHAEPCEELEIVMHNPDKVRHSVMLPGLNPMFSLEFTGPGVRTASLVTPAEDVTLEFHCHVPTHEKMGMHGRLIVGDGGDGAAGQRVARAEPAGAGAHRRQGQRDETARRPPASPPPEGDGRAAGTTAGTADDRPSAAELHRGVGVVVAVEPRQNLLVVDHEEIPGFMAPMVMGFPVADPELLRGLEAGNAIAFTVDATRNALVEVRARDPGAVPPGAAGAAAGPPLAAVVDGPRTEDGVAAAVVDGPPAEDGAAAVVTPATPMPELSASDNRRRAIRGMLPRPQ